MDESFCSLKAVRIWRSIFSKSSISWPSIVDLFEPMTDCARSIAKVDWANDWSIVVVCMISEGALEPSPFRRRGVTDAFRNGLD